MASQELARSAEPSDAGGAVARRRLDAAHFARVENLPELRAERFHSRGAPSSR
jgi:hypothetical protein